jgi:hypothetical protein
MQYSQKTRIYYGKWIWGPRGKIDLAIDELNTEKPMIILPASKPLQSYEKASPGNTVLVKSREKAWVY